ncbi:MAG: hypothetical protein ACI4MK_11475, partial [Aristaeellaceae bacterium]
AFTDDPVTTDEPASTDEPAFTDDPVTTDEPASTDEPVTTDDPVSTDEPASTDAPATSPADGPLYVVQDGVKVYGRFDALYPLGLTIVLYTTAVVQIEGYSAETLAKVSFALDGEVFTAEDDCIYLSVRDPNGFVKENTFFLWAGKKGEEPAPASDPLEDTITGTDEEVLEQEIQVVTHDYDNAAPCRPTFTLTAFPAIGEGMTYAVILDGGEPEAIPGDSYAPTVSGEYRFALLAADGTLLARSARFPVTLAEADDAPAAASADDTAPADDNAAPAEDADDEAAPVDDDTFGSPAEDDAAPTDDNAAPVDDDAAPTASSQAWALVEGVRTGGTLEQLLGKADGAIYISTGKVIVLNGSLTALAGKTLLPDPDVFGEGYVVRIAGENQGVAREDSLFVWVEARGQSAQTEAALTVVTEGWAADGWSNVAPVFSLVTEPAPDTLPEGCALAVSVDGGAPVLLTGQDYTAREQGDYTLRFSLLGPDGEALAQSEACRVRLDTDAPLMQVRAEGGNLQVTVGDGLSGGDAVSLDGGETWYPLTEKDSGVSVYVYAAEAEVTFPRGSIIVRDRAGNTTAYPDEVTLRPSAQAGASRGGFGGTASRTVTHAASDVTVVVAYNAVQLILDDGSMTQLTVGDEELELELLYTGEEARNEDDQPAFTAAFADMQGLGVADTLVLTPVNVPEEDAGDYAWRFSGQVYKILAASGIDYLALRMGDQVTALSTAGFSGGLRYNMYRAEGLVSKDFSYTVRMDPLADAMEMDVTVEGVTWEMSGDTDAEFYYYDVIVGPLEAFSGLEG